MEKDIKKCKKISSIGIGIEIESNGEYWRSIKTTLNLDHYINSWHKNKYTYIETKEFAKDLGTTNCCIDCINCIDCQECYNCIDCVNCKGCNVCKACIDCNDCYNYFNGKYLEQVYKDKYVEPFINKQKEKDKINNG